MESLRLEKTPQGGGVQPLPDKCELLLLELPFLSWEVEVMLGIAGHQSSQILDLVSFVFLDH